jgi:hypothetical protein
MKKLLALILCVMMFVALIPTAAFAAIDPKDPDQVAEATRLEVEARNAAEAADEARAKATKAAENEETAKNAYDPVAQEYDTYSTALKEAKRAYEVAPSAEKETKWADVVAAQKEYDAFMLRRYDDGFNGQKTYSQLKAAYAKYVAATETAAENANIAEAAARVAALEFGYYTTPSDVLAAELAEAEAAYEALVPVVVPVIVKPWLVVGNDLTGYYSTSVNKDAISDLNDAIENMYNGLAVNQAVFGTAQALHSLADGMVKDLLADVDDYDALDGTTVDHDDLVTNARAFLKGVIGAQIENYLVKREDSFMNDDGTVDYKDYLNVYTKAVNDALTSSKAQKGIEAFVYAVTALKMQDAINDKTDDLRDEIIDWNDFGSKWSEFGFSQDIDDLFDLIGGPDEDYTFVDPTGLTVPEALTLDAILNP